MESMKNLWEKTIKPKIPLFAVSFAIGLAVMGVIWFQASKADKPEPEVKTIVNTQTKEVEKKVNVTTEFVEDHLADIGELATVEAQYMGVITVEDEEGISFINKTGYSMLYTIEAKCGIQFEDIKVEVSDTEVKVTLPEPQVLSRHADGKTLQFFDEKWALFKSNEMNDVSNAVTLAEEDFDQQEEKIAQYLDLAKQRAIVSVHSLLKGVIGDKQLTVL